MKTRKTLSHAQLISEVFSQLKFPLTVTPLYLPVGSLSHLLLSDGRGESSHRKSARTRVHETIVRERQRLRLRGLM